MEPAFGNSGGISAPIQILHRLLPLINGFRLEQWNDNTPDFAMKVDQIVGNTFLIPSFYVDMHPLNAQEKNLVSKFKTSIGQLKIRLKNEEKIHPEKKYLIFQKEVKRICRCLQNSFPSESLNINSGALLRLANFQRHTLQVSANNPGQLVPTEGVADKTTTQKFMIRKGIMDPRYLGIQSLRELIDYFGFDECNKVKNLNFVPFEFIFRPSESMQCFFSPTTDYGGLIWSNFPSLEFFSFKQPRHGSTIPSFIWLHGINKMVIDLNCFACLPEMKALRVSLSRINSLNELAYSNIEELFLDHCQDAEGGALLDYSGLRFLPKLTALELDNFVFMDLKPLVPLTNLKKLILDGRSTQIRCEDYKDLAFLPNLEYLSLSNCFINNLEYLGPLNKLTTLALTSCPIQSLNPLISLPNLQHLAINNCNIDNWTVLLSMPRLKDIRVRVPKDNEIPPEIINKLVAKGITVIDD